MTEEELTWACLEQQKKHPQALHLLVKKLGTEQALAFLKETLAIEAQGSMLLSDGSHYRPRGGQVPLAEQAKDGKIR